MFRSDLRRRDFIQNMLQKYATVLQENTCAGASF